MKITDANSPDTSAEDQKIFQQGAKDGEVVEGHNLTRQGKRGTQADTKSNWPYMPGK